MMKLWRRGLWVVLAAVLIVLVLRFFSERDRKIFEATEVLRERQAVGEAGFLWDRPAEER
jgi:membrane protein implicated in regulation of membrane protease activity